MKQFTIILLAAICCAITLSCSESILNEPTDFPDESHATKSSPEVPLDQNFTPMVLGERLNNPYALEVMQAAAESLTPAGKPVPTLTASDFYVRFLPKDSAELAVLYNVENLELFDYPLDYEILVDGDYYHDPSIPEGNPTWLYTTVSSDYDFPDVEYEILETCYIPQESSSTKSSSSVTFSPEDLEREAYRLAGLDSMWIDDPLTRAAEYPSGRFTVYDTEDQEYVPVKGVKIRVHNIIKWATAYTDQNGYYTIGKKYRTNVHYAMVFKNTKGFKVWGNWAMLAPANHNMRFQSNSGYSDDFDTYSNAWDWATINNAAYDYYNMCSIENIMPPPEDLTIWCLRPIEWNSAIMVPHIPCLNNAVNALLTVLMGGIGLLGVFIDFLPDVFIYSQSLDSKKIYKCVCHELSHASHFMKAGDEYWCNYITYIASCWINGQDTYGNGTLPNNGICAVGEMWGYAMGYIYQYEKYNNGVSKNDVYPENDTSYYFHPAILWDIYRDSYLDKGEIYRCLSPDVDDVPTLRNKMKTLYPDKAVDLEFIFARYGEYDGMGYWAFKNATTTPKYIHVGGNCRTNFSETHINNPSLDIGKNLNLLNSGHLVMPNETVIIDSLTYNDGRQYDFYDILNVEEIAPSCIFIADENGLILERATLDGSIKLFTVCGSWKEVAGSKSKTWTFSYVGKKNHPIIKQ